MKNEYLNRLNSVFDDPVLKRLRKESIQEQIPIMTEEGIHFLIQLIQIGKINRVLEIGTAIGYSAIAISRHTSATVVTIEKDKRMEIRANKNIEESNLKDKINVIFADALDIEIQSLDKVDLIFIDAAKAQYIKFFEKYEPILLDKGVIISDNLLFRGQVEDTSSIISRNRKQLVRKIQKYNTWLLENQNFNTYIYEIGDGIAVSIKK
ncbi:MAG: O-methyltransferase [Firmicutes bacterium]|nr:O-methyltransferase [Bacillota bacterium]